EVFCGVLKVAPHPSVSPSRCLPLRFTAKNFLEFNKLAKARHGIEMDLHAPVSVNLAGLTDLHKNRERPPKNFEDRVRVIERRADDLTRLHARRVGPLIVHKLPGARARDGPHLEASIPEEEGRVDLVKRSDVLRARQECTGI